MTTISELSQFLTLLVSSFTSNPAEGNELERLNDKCLATVFSYASIVPPNRSLRPLIEATNAETLQRNPILWLRVFHPEDIINAIVYPEHPELVKIRRKFGDLEENQLINLLSQAMRCFVNLHRGVPQLRSSIVPYDEVNTFFYTRSIMCRFVNCDTKVTQAEGLEKGPIGITLKFFPNHPLYHIGRNSMLWSGSLFTVFYLETNLPEVLHKLESSINAGIITATLTTKEVGKNPIIITQEREFVHRRFHVYNDVEHFNQTVQQINRNNTGIEMRVMVINSNPETE